MLILVVDDEESLCDLLAEVLGERYEVIKAFNGKDALEMVLANPPDLIISDIMMPQMSGVELLDALRANAATANIPVVLLSAVPQNTHVLQQKAEAFLRKPYEIDVIEHLVENLFKEKSANPAPQRFIPVANAQTFSN